MSLAFMSRLKRDRMRKRRIVKRITNIILICVVSAATAYVITRPIGGTGFNPSEAVRNALLRHGDSQTHATTRTASVKGGNALSPTDNPANYYGYKLSAGPY